MADILIREKDGVEEFWYSKEYFKKHLQKSFYEGIRKGIKVEIHAIQPMDGKMVDDLTEEFNRRVHTISMEAYEKGEIPTIL
jgi:hypothetical protein